MRVHRHDRLKPAINMRGDRSLVTANVFEPNFIDRIQPADGLQSFSKHHIPETAALWRQFPNPRFDPLAIGANRKPCRSSEIKRQYQCVSSPMADNCA